MLELRIADFGMQIEMLHGSWCPCPNVSFLMNSFEEVMDLPLSMEFWSLTDLPIFTRIYTRTITAQFHLFTD